MGNRFQSAVDSGIISHSADSCAIRKPEAFAIAIHVGHSGDDFPDCRNPWYRLRDWGKTLKSNYDVINGMGKSMSTLGTYIVLVFFASQFVAYFNWTNLGLITAIKGAGLIGSIGLGRIPLMISLVFMAAIINLVVGSASAKWAIMAPVFIPMFMLLGYSPEFTQLTYRVGDSVTNIIAPMMSYFALIVAFVEKYDKRAGIGTIIATMLPYTFVFLFVWLALLISGYYLGIPIGPGAELFYAL
jgi:aminobenzoyl-glutamate transport protein